MTSTLTDIEALDTLNDQSPAPVGYYWTVGAPSDRSRVRWAALVLDGGHLEGMPEPGTAPVAVGPDSRVWSCFEPSPRAIDAADLALAEHYVYNTLAADEVQARFAELLEFRTDERLAAIARADAFIQEVKAIPEDERTAMEQPDKYSGPIGVPVEEA